MSNEYHTERQSRLIIKELEAQLERLTSRGFEDLHHENEQLQAQLADAKDMSYKLHTALVKAEAQLAEARKWAASMPPDSVKKLQAILEKVS